MKNSEAILDRYKIPLSGLSLGTHEYTFLLDDAMFSYFQHPDVEKGNVTAKVILDKGSNAIELTISMTGDLQVQCDRCLDLFSYPVEASEIVVFTLGEQEGYTDEEVIVLSKEQTILDISSDLYEIAVTQLPIKKLHPKDSKGKSTCNPEMLKLLDQYSIREDNNSPMQKLGDII